MKAVLQSVILIALFAVSATSVSAQTATLTGVVTDASDGQPLIGANVIVRSPGSPAIVGGAATNLDGQYTVSPLRAGTYDLTVSFIGYNEFRASVSLSVGETETLLVVLDQAGFDLNTVIVTASRQQEKALDAPASISVIDAEEITADVAASTVETLRNTTGVDMAKTGVDRRELVLRGFNNAFSGATYVLTDYRQTAAPSLGVNIYGITPNHSVDIERVEVVRGPGSALYGAGVDAGVVHFITKDPWRHPGGAIAISGGERSLFGVEGRYAGVSADKKFGYKVTGAYLQADDWQMNPSDSLDAAEISGDIVPRDNDYSKVNINGTVEYRIGDNATLIANGGYSSLKSTVLSGIGTVQADGYGYSYGQLRFVSGGFFAQTYFNRNAAGDSFVYDQDIDGDGIPNPVIDNSIQFNAQAQYDVQLAQGRHRIIFGGDLDIVTPDTEGSIYGRFEDNDQITEVGGYAQGSFALTSQIDMTLAGRGDYNNVVEQFQFSPRAALIFKPAPGHSIRGSYNRAFSSPGNNSLFLDIVAGSIPTSEGPIIIRGLGSNAGWTWQRDPSFTAIAGTDLVVTSLNPAILGQPTPAGLPLDAVYGSLYQGLVATPSEDIAALLVSQGIPIDAASVDLLKSLLNPTQTVVGGFSQGQVTQLNRSTLMLDPVEGNNVSDIAPLGQTTTNQLEVGYKGVVNNSVLIAIDGYWARQENFVGPLRSESPFVTVPNLARDLSAGLAAGITNNQVLLGALMNFGLDAETAAGLIVGLGASALPDDQTPIGIVEAVENRKGLGAVPEAFLGYRNFGRIEYFGADVSIQVLATDELSIFGNLSVVSDDFFDNEELGEEDPGLSVALNAPMFKGKFGARYAQAGGGFMAGASVRYTDSFPVESGPYVGTVPSYTLLDASIGYDFAQYARGLRVDIAVQNILDDRHREFFGAPRIGRMAIGKLTYTFQPPR